MGWFNWLSRRRQRRRERSVEGPFPGHWHAVLQQNVPTFSRISEDERVRLQELVRIFVAEKDFLGGGGLRIDDEIKITIAGQACILLLGLPHLGVYPAVHEVIVHPSDFGEVVEAVGPDGREYHIEEMHAGEAWRRGPVVLAWDSVEHAIVSSAAAYNVVLHEFAHVLDMTTGGRADGVPPLESKEEYAEWWRVFRKEYEDFVAAVRRGELTLIDAYGAKDHAEFFAVATEHFFEEPRRLKGRHPELYEQLRRFYRQDPARWARTRTGHWA